MASRPMAVSAVKMRIASRAHSFKENFLEALGQASPMAAEEAGSRHAHHTPPNKKTGSSDNLLAASSPLTPMATDQIVRDIQVALRYFEDAVSKGTFELLPGCASVVLERVVGFQAAFRHNSYKNNNSKHMDGKAPLQTHTAQLYRAVANMTRWADAVIVTGKVEPSCDFRQSVVEPVRRAVVVLANAVNGNKGASNSNSRHNSLPDISSPETSDHLNGGLSPVATPKATPRAPPKVPHRKASEDLSLSPSPPPLPPKHSLSFQSATETHAADWFSNPLFERAPARSPESPPPPHGLDTTLPESAAFPYMDETDCRESSPPPALLPKKHQKPPKAASTHYDNLYGHTLTHGRVLGHGHHFPMLMSSQSFDSQPHRSSTSSAGSNGDAVAALSQLDHSCRSEVSSPVMSSFYSPKTQWLAANGAADSALPPPLPPKRRDILNYMELLGQSLMPSREDLLQSLAQTQILLQNVWAENYHQFGEFVPDNSSFNFPPAQDLFTRNVDLSRLPVDMPRRFPDISLDDSAAPPALPPKKKHSQHSHHHHHHHHSVKERIVPIVRESDGAVITPNRAVTTAKRCSSGVAKHHNNNNVVGVTKRCSKSNGSKKRLSAESSASSSNSSEKYNNRSSSHSSLEQLSAPGPTSPSKQPKPSVIVEEDSPLNTLHWPPKFDSLIYLQNGEGALELRAGSVDELIVLAATTGGAASAVNGVARGQNRDYLYQDAFLLTYRTFIPTLELLAKLEHRFRRFSVDEDDVGQSGGGAGHDPGEAAARLRAARSAFSFLVRVVDSLIDSDFLTACGGGDVCSNLSAFSAELVARGELLLARVLRSKFIEKYEEFRARTQPEIDFSIMSINSRPPSLLQFKSSDVAEQITLLDAHHFWKLEPAELLIWVKEQNEEKSPNLVRFTKHFNAMSYWCRTRILQETEPRERERLVTKFIKVMKFLRRHNNFNSYLALLSALDSASVRRLDWPKTIVDTIKDYSAIIDFTGSFKAYREALSHAKPPVIPYMGLVLQDLTFVHIGNNDNVKGKVNFAKRWQQYNILDNIRRFKRTPYRFERREDIAQAFGNFENALSENDIWLLSEKIKPRQRASPSKLDAADAAEKLHPPQS